MRIPGNFDRWMFNYKEGNLSPEEKNYFESFMLNDAQYEEDIDAWDNAYIRNSDFKYKNVAALQKDSFFKRYGKWAALLLLFISSAGVLAYWAGTSDNYLYSSRGTDANPVFTSSFVESGFDGLIATQSISGQNAAQQTTSAGQASQVVNNSGVSGAIVSFSGNDQIVGESPTLSQDDMGLWEEGDGEIRINRNSVTVSDYSQLAIEQGKVDNSSSKYSGGFSRNPLFVKTKSVNIVKLKRGNILKYKLKRFYNKIERRSGYPLALVNLKDPELIIPDRNLLAFNPGFTGGSRGFRIGMDYRNQWLGKDVNSQNSTIYFDNYMPTLKSGVGASIKYSDYNYGSFQNYVASLFYSFKFELGKNVIFEPGVKLSMGMTSTNSEKVTPGSFIEMDRGRVLPTYENGNQSGANNLWYKDYGVGFVINAGRFYVGANADNIAQHDQTVYTADEKQVLRSPRLYTAVAGFDFQSRDKKRLLSPVLSYYQFGQKKEAWVGATAQLNWFTIGASYSTNNEYAASVGLKFKSFRLNYQMDYLESEFLQKSFVSHNIGIRFSAKNKTTR